MKFEIEIPELTAQVGDVFQDEAGTIWYVDHVNVSGTIVDSKLCSWTEFFFDIEYTLVLQRGISPKGVLLRPGITIVTGEVDRQGLIGGWEHEVVTADTRENIWEREDSWREQLRSTTLQ